jgi:methyl-accepting chemotaxis protein
MPQTMEENQISMLAQIEDLYRTHIEATRSILDQGRELAESVGANHRIMEDASTQLRDSADHLRQTANSFGALGLQVQRSAETMSSNLIGVTEAVENLTNENTSTAARMNDAFEQIRQVGERMERTSQDLSGSAEVANSGFERLREHHREFAQSLRSHVDDLNEQINRILQDYDNQVRETTTDRMNEWNRHTNTFTQQMTQTVRIMAQIVDDIESNQSNGSGS